MFPIVGNVKVEYDSIAYHSLKKETVQASQEKRWSSLAREPRTGLLVAHGIMGLVGGQ